MQLFTLPLSLYPSYLFSPDVSNALVGDSHVNHRIADRAMAHEGLQCPCIDSTARQGRIRTAAHPQAALALAIAGAGETGAFYWLALGG